VHFESTLLCSVFAWRHGSHIGVPKQWNSDHVGLPNQSCGVQLFSYTNTSFCTSTCLPREWKRSMNSIASCCSEIPQSSPLGSFGNWASVRGENRACFAIHQLNIMRHLRWRIKDGTLWIVEQVEQYLPRSLIWTVTSEDYWKKKKLNNFSYSYRCKMMHQKNWMYASRYTIWEPRGF